MVKHKNILLLGVGLIAIIYIYGAYAGKQHKKSRPQPAKAVNEIATLYFAKK